LEFIVRNVLIKQKKIMPTEEVYNKLIEKAAKQGKKTKQISYEDAYNSNLLYLMFSYYITAIQSAVPEIKTNKTFPGCKRAFSGYPIDGNADTSAITYIACLAQQLKKSRVQPWKAISSANEITIMKKMQGIIDNFILNEPEIQERFNEKREYLKTQEKEEIPEEHDIRSWSTFLPPLNTPEIGKLQPLAQDFSSKLLSELRKGEKGQIAMIEQAKGRILNYSIAIQTLIHKVVASHKLLLNNSGNEPFLQNACCETKTPICLEYFTERQPDIKRYNEIVKEIANLLIGVHLSSKAPFLFDPRDTRTVYPEIASGFNEDTIYQAIITYCRFNSPLPIPEALISICNDKPADLNVNDSMDKLIAQLKHSGRVYTRETLDALMTEINKSHIVHINLDK
jgi:hypothetical protein